MGATTEVGGGAVPAGRDARWARRPFPRISTTLGAAGALLAVFGSWLVTSDEMFGDEFGEPSQAPGILLGVVLVAVGWGLLVLHRSEALSTAGVVSLLVGWPTLVGFVTLDVDGYEPFSIDAVLVVATLGWLAAYLFGPNPRHAALLVASLLAVWLLVLFQLNDGPWSPWSFLDPVTPYPTSYGQPYYIGGGGSTSTMEQNVRIAGVLSLLFGGGYLAMVRTADARGRRGLATSFALPAALATAYGAAYLSEDLEMVGTGLLAIVLGGAFMWVGTRGQRRGTSWLGGFGVFLGVSMIIGEIAESAQSGGALALAAGCAIVLVAHLLGDLVADPPELEDAHLVRPAAAAAVPDAGRDRASDAAWMPPPRPDEEG